MFIHRFVLIPLITGETIGGHPPKTTFTIKVLQIPLAEKCASKS